MDASLCVAVKTRCTYGPTIVAIGQGSFVRGFIETVTSFTDLLIEDVLGKKDSPLYAVFPHLCQFIRFGGFNKSTHVHIHTTQVYTKPGAFDTSGDLHCLVAKSPSLPTLKAC